MTITLPPIPARIDHLIIHATATPASMDIGADWVDRVHRQKGWNGCGYNMIIRRDGTLEHEGTGARTRPFSAIASHVGGCGRGWNARSLGVAMAGGVKEDGKTPENNFTQEQFSTLLDVIMAVIAAGIKTSNIMGHRDLIKITKAAPKACPCFSVIAWLEGEYSDRRGRLPFASSKRPARGEALGIPKTYTVEEGESLWQISDAHGVRLQDLLSLNDLDEGHLIFPGQELRLRN